ncbi:hypothetical protein [Aquimarina litoralis]|uniref:hypothetical protein n=1 Tax=Aquimarina litoralis TaxID=584605 RepID=UPI001C586435|nr:hypothetical protein [Aquimarina litoralis]MBW1294144.1 hypothetical protein [Aquimarina litoralis]
MALDFHRLDTNEYLFGVNDTEYAYLESIFIEFTQQTGIFIDPYGDTQLKVTHLKMIIQMIDTNLTTESNMDKEKTKVIQEFRRKIAHFSDKGITLKALGD